MSDMISREAAIAALMEAGLAFGYGKAVDAIRALPAVEVGARELEWRKVAPHGLHEAYGLCWKYQIREGTDAIVRWQSGHMGTWFEAANVDTAKAAAQADYAARIRSALTATPAQDVAGLVRRRAAQTLWDMLHMENGAHEGMTHEEVNGLWNSVKDEDGFSAVTTFLARMMEASPRPINWRDDQEAVVEDDEPMIGRDYE